MSQQSFSTYLWPHKGLDEDQSYHSQRENTTVDCLNVMPYDPLLMRNRGGQRYGLEKYNSTQIDATQIQDITHVTNITASAASQSSMVARSVTGCVVAGGDVKKYTSGAITAATNGTGALDSNAPVIFSAPLFGVLYFADGVNEKQWTASTNTVATWAESAGTMPINGSDHPRLIELWRSRIVLSGLKGDGHNWFMSKAGDGTDWDYAPASTTETDAVAGNNSQAGKIGEVVNCMIPYSDDLLIFGCDSSIWFMTGDPAAGGRIDNVSTVTGMAFGRPYTRDPAGRVYFMGSRGGIYSMSPGEPPKEVSGKRIDKRFREIDFSNTSIRMAYDHAVQGIWCFLTPLDGGATVHYFYDLRTDSFWPLSFANASHNPSAVHVFDGDTAADRVMIVGGMDGYLRNFSSSAKSDDGSAISSYAYIGPIKARSQAATILREVRAVVDCDATVDVDVFGGDSVQSAYDSTAAHSYQIVDGRNRTSRHRVRGHAFYIKIRNDRLDETWALETLQIGRYKLGPSHQRKVY